MGPGQKIWLEGGKAPKWTRELRGVPVINWRNRLTHNERQRFCQNKPASALPKVRFFTHKIERTVETHNANRKSTLSS
jgi:hypothetical protein